MGAFTVFRLFSKLIALVLAVAIVRRSALAVGGPSRPGSRGSLLPWMGLMVGIVVIFELCRSWLPFRL